MDVARVAKLAQAGFHDASTSFRPSVERAGFLDPEAFHSLGARMQTAIEGVDGMRDADHALALLERSLGRRPRVAPDITVGVQAIRQHTLSNLGELRGQPKSTGFLKRLLGRQEAPAAPPVADNSRFREGLARTADELAAAANHYGRVAERAARLPRTLMPPVATLADEQQAATRVMSLLPEKPAFRAGRSAPVMTGNPESLADVRRYSDEALRYYSEVKAEAAHAARLQAARVPLADLAGVNIAHAPREVRKADRAAIRTVIAAIERQTPEAGERYTDEALTSLRRLLNEGR